MRATFVTTACMILGVACDSAAQATAPVLPPVGTRGVSFALPEGGGGSFGYRKMTGPARSLGVDLQFGFAWTDEDSDRRDDDPPSRTDFALGVAPDLRLYRMASGPVVPFLELGARLGYRDAAGDPWGLDGALSVGLGAEWFPLQGMSVSGSTGARTSMIHHDAGSSSQTRVALGLFRFELALTLYF